MDAAAGLEHFLDIYGFAAANCQRIVDIEGITDLADVASFTNRKIDIMAKDSVSRRTAPERLVFVTMCVKKFKALSYWVKDQVRRGLVPDPLVFDTAARVASMDAMRADEDFKEVLAKEDIKVPVFVSGSDFPRWMDDTQNALGACMGVLGIPVDYITRPEVVPEVFAHPREQLMYEGALAGPNLIRDNDTLFFLLQSSMDKKDKQSGIAHIKPYERAQNGRAAWLSLVHHYGAGGEQKKRVEMAKMTIKNLHYRDESVFPFENFSTLLTEALYILKLVE